MTINNTNTENLFNGDGTVTVFPTNITAYDEDQIEVYLRANGVDTLQTLTTHYTLSNLGEGKEVTVVFSTAPSASQQVVVIRNTPRVQETDITASRAFFASVLEKQNDLNVMMIQEMQKVLDRSLRLNSGGPSVSSLPRTPNNIIGIGANGAPALFPIDTNVTTDLAFFSWATYEDAQLGDTGTKDFILVEGYLYEYDAAGTDLQTGDGRTWTLSKINSPVRFYAETDTELAAIEVPEAVKIIARVPTSAAPPEQVAPVDRLTYWVRWTGTPVGDYFTTAGPTVWVEAGLTESEVLSIMTSTLQGIFEDQEFMGLIPFASRDAFINADILSSVTKHAWFTPSGHIMRVKRDEGGDVVQANGETWTPLGVPFPDHYATNAMPGTTDMSAAIQAAGDCAASRVTLDQGADRDAAIEFHFLPTKYHMLSGVSWDASHDRLRPVANGCYITTTYDGPLFSFGDNGWFDGSGTGGGTLYNPEMQGFVLRNLNPTATSSAAIRMGRCSNWILDNNEIWDFWVGIDFFANGVGFLGKNTGYVRSRTSTTLAFLRAQSVPTSDGSYRPGGGWHFLNNEIEGNPDNKSNLQYGYLIKSVDGLYFGGNHVKSCLKGFATVPDGDTANNVITDIQSLGGNYFDEPASGGRNVEHVGSVTYAGTSGQANGDYKNITWDRSDFFRGAGAAAQGIFVSVADGGGFATARSGLEGFALTGIFDTHVDVAIQAQGADSSKLECIGLQIDGPKFSGGLADGVAGGVSCVLVEARSVTITNPVCLEETAAPDYAFSLNLSGAASDPHTLILRGADISRSLYTSAPYNLDTEVGAAVFIDGITPNDAGGRHIRHPIATTTADYNAAKPYLYQIPASRVGLGVRLRAVAHSTSASVTADQYASYDVDAFFRKNSAGVVSKVARTEIVGTKSFTNNQRPVDVVLLTGATWTASMALALGDVVVNSSGNAYLVITTDGAAGATEPTHTSGALLIDGVRYLYLGAEAATTIAVVLSMENNITATWRGEVELLQNV